MRGEGRLESISAATERFPPRPCTNTSPRHWLPRSLVASLALRELRHESSAPRRPRRPRRRAIETMHRHPLELRGPPLPALGAPAQAVVGFGRPLVVADLHALGCVLPSMRRLMPSPGRRTYVRKREVSQTEELSSPNLVSKLWMRGAGRGLSCGDHANPVGKRRDSHWQTTFARVATHETLGTSL